MEAVREEEVKLRGVKFVKKEVGFKPGVKERYEVIDVQSGESEEKVMGEGIGKQEMEELVPE